MSQADDYIEESNITLLPASNKKIDLHDSHSIRRELGAVYRDMRAGKLEMQDGTKLGYMLNLLLKAYETCELEKKLDSIQLELKKR